MWDKVTSFFRLPEVIEAQVRRIKEDWPTDTFTDDLAGVEKELEKNRRLYEKLHGKYRAALADDGDMMAKQPEADYKALAEEIKAYEGWPTNSAPSWRPKSVPERLRASPRTTAGNGL